MSGKWWLRELKVNGKSSQRHLRGKRRDPFCFLKRLKDPMRKYSRLNPQSQLLQGLLKVCLVTKSLPNITKRLQNQTIGKKNKLKNYWGKFLREGRRKNKRHKLWYLQWKEEWTSLLSRLLCRGTGAHLSQHTIKREGVANCQTRWGHS